MPGDKYLHTPETPAGTATKLSRQAFFFQERGRGKQRSHEGHSISSNVPGRTLIAVFSRSFGMLQYGCFF
jgi:hypothetical protein